MVEHRNAGTASGGEGQGSEGPGPGTGAAERVAKALARSGVASRREIERLIAEGRVALNGKVLDTPAVKVEPGDLLTVDGKAVEAAEPTRVWRYHKPVGLLTTHKDPQGRPTVFENLPDGMPRVISVGRLDINSEGLLLLTNDGELARALELPSSGWVRKYRARARGRVTQEKLDRLKDGVTVEGVNYGPIEARLDKAKEGAGGANLWITVAITEGKNREVRRVLQHLGLEVNRLIRLAYGPFALGALGAGEVEEVGPRVIREQLAELVAPENMPTGSRVQPLPGAGAKKPRRQTSKADVAVEKRALPRPSAPRSKPRGTADPFARREEAASRPSKAPRKGARPPAKTGARAERAERAERPMRGFGARPDRPERADRPERPERRDRRSDGRERPERAPGPERPARSQAPRAPYGAREPAAKPVRSGYGARAAEPGESGGYGKRAPARKTSGYGRSGAEARAERTGGFGTRERPAAERTGGYGARERAESAPEGGYGERKPAARNPRREPPKERAEGPPRAARKPGWAKPKPKGRPPAKGRGPGGGGPRPPRKPR